MAQKITSEEVLDYLGNYIQLSLAEIEDQYGGKKDGFLIGQCYAFVECLEIIVLYWNKAHLYGLNFAPEERYPLD